MKSKLPMIYQAESIECGLASLAMILQYYHLSVTLSELRQQYPLNTSGASIGMLMLIARTYQLEAKVLRLELEELSKQTLPIILHWNLNHFVVLKSIKNNKYIIHDPARGVVKLNKLAVSDGFTGIVLQCLPTVLPLLPLKPLSNISLISLLKQLSNGRFILYKFFIYIILYQCLVILFPRVVQQIVETGLMQYDAKFILILVASYIWLRILSVIAKVGKDLCVLKIGNELSRILSFDIGSKLISLPYQYFATRHTSETINRVNTVEQMRQIITSGWIEGCWDTVVCLLILLAIFITNPYLGLITCTCSIVFLFVRHYFSQAILVSAHDVEIKRTEEQAYLFENIRAIQAIKLFSKEKQRLSQWKKSYASFLQSSAQLKKIKLTIDTIKEFLIGIELISVISLMYFRQEMTAGLLYFYLLYRQIYNTAYFNALEKWHDLKLLRIYYSRLEDIILPSISPAIQLLNSPHIALKITQLSFRYSPLESFVFENINLTINKGEMVVLVGSSGKGKTTLMKLMMGLLSPTQGFVQLSTSQIACVMQQDCLLSGTIAQNISFSSSPNLHRVSHYAKLMGIYDEIMKMPMKFETLVGDLGATLSGGQKQRILLARALYIEPLILFLDEATSHLDIENEKKVNTAIKNLGITCIMIAHREQTIAMADRAISI